MTVMTCAFHGTAFTHGCPGCDAAEDWQIVEEVAAQDLEMCPRDEHVWVELEPDVAECSVCNCIEFKNATMEQLRRHLRDEDAA